MSGLYTLNGIVVSSKRVGNDVHFTIERPGIGQNEVICPFFFPVHEGDGVEVVVTRLPSGKLQVQQKPFGQVSSEPHNVQASFVTALRRNKFSPGAAAKLYQAFMKQANSYCYGEAHVARAQPVNPLAHVKESGEKIPAADPDPESVHLVTSNKTRYRGDGVVPYLSDMAAAIIVKGDRTLINTLMDGVTDMSPAQMSTLVSWWHKNRSLRRLYLFGLNNTEIIKCELPLDDIYDICCTNPFKLPQIPLEKAVDIMLSIRKRPTEEMMECGRIVRKIYENCSSRGWTTTPINFMRSEYPKTEYYRPNLEKDYDVIIERGLVYLKKVYKIERDVTDYFDKLIHTTAVAYNARAGLIPPDLALFKRKNLTEEQRTAIMGALFSRISIITGGAGVGKTSAIDEIVRNRVLAEQSIALTAFTGKAVSRINEVIGRSVAMTMDRMISVCKGMEFTHLIIDEGSMVTIELMWRFIQAFPGEYSITIVGDCNQLPPIGWGCLMSELMASGRVPVYYLTQNHRIVPLQTGHTEDQAPGTVTFERSILENANELIRSSRCLDRPLLFEDGPGFTQMTGDHNTVKTIVKALYDSGIELDKLMIICPYNEELRNLNEMVQSIYLQRSINCPGEFVRDKTGKLWCTGDRVMMMRNNYTINVMNGDEGWVTKVEDEGVTVKFKDGAEHLFKFWIPDTDDDITTKEKARVSPEDDDDFGIELSVKSLSHSFAITIHKSQGSEREFLIVYIPHRSNKYGSISTFLNINLLYTAITRAKRSVWLVGDKADISPATMRYAPKRFDSLSTLLRMKRDSDLEEILLPLTRTPVIPTSRTSGNSLGSTVGEEVGYEDDLTTSDDLADFFGDIDE